MSSVLKGFSCFDGWVLAWCRGPYEEDGEWKVDVGLVERLRVLLKRRMCLAPSISLADDMSRVWLRSDLEAFAERGDEAAEKSKV